MAHLSRLPPAREAEAALKICPETRGVSKALLLTSTTPPFCNLARKKLGEGGFAEVLLGFRRLATRRRGSDATSRTLGVQDLASFHRPLHELPSSTPRKIHRERSRPEHRCHSPCPTARTSRRASCPASLLGQSKNFYKYFEEVAIKVTQRAITGEEKPLSPTRNAPIEAERGSTRIAGDARAAPAQEQSAAPAGAVIENVVASAAGVPSARASCEDGCFGVVLQILSALQTENRHNKTAGAAAERPGARNLQPSRSPGISQAVDARAQQSERLEQRNLEILRKIQQRPHPNVVTFYGSFDHRSQRYLALGLLKFDLSVFFDGILQRCKVRDLDRLFFQSQLHGSENSGKPGVAGSSGDFRMVAKADETRQKRGLKRKQSESSLVTNNGPGESIVRELFNQLVRGVHHLHDALKVAHLDLKLENLMLAEVPQVYWEKNRMIEELIRFSKEQQTEFSEPPRSTSASHTTASKSNIATTCTAETSYKLNNNSEFVPSAATCAQQHEHDWKIFSHARSAKPPFLLKIIDFGISLPFGDEAVVRSDRIPLGTREYRPPELHWKKVREQTKIDVRKVDWFACGVVLFKMKFLGSNGGFSTKHRFREIVVDHRENSRILVHSQTANGETIGLEEFLDTHNCVWHVHLTCFCAPRIQVAEKSCCTYAWKRVADGDASMHRSSAVEISTYGSRY
ncbi:unnamed protein product [Amoebophrya sp. A120]|nr:unnamed protein product [Amoebophrya sp. A120]|eukprot:GSA120T00020226001.1